MRYFENIIRHFATTLVGLIAILGGVAMGAFMIAENVFSWYGVAIVVVCFVAGARLLGAESLASEYAQLVDFIKNPFKK